jgi:hypothetical protein
VVTEQLAALEPVLRAVNGALVLLVVVLLGVSVGRAVRARRARGQTGPLFGLLDERPAHDAVPRVLEARGLASESAVAEMNAREQLFLFEEATSALGPRGVARSGRGTPVTPLAVQSPRAAALETLHCPLCAAALATGGSAAYYVGACSRCGRRISARVDGARLVVTVDEAAR